MKVQVGDLFEPKNCTENKTWIICEENPILVELPKVQYDFEPLEIGVYLPYLGQAKFDKNVLVFEIKKKQDDKSLGYVCFFSRDAQNTLKRSKHAGKKCSSDDDIIIKRGKRFSIDINKARDLLGKRHEIVGLASKGLDFKIQEIDEEKGTVTFSLFCSGEKYIEWESAINEFKKIVKQGGI